MKEIIKSIIMCALWICVATSFIVEQYNLSILFMLMIINENIEARLK